MPSVLCQMKFGVLRFCQIEGTLYKALIANSLSLLQYIAEVLSKIPFRHSIATPPYGLPTNNSPLSTELLPSSQSQEIQYLTTEGNNHVSWRQSKFADLHNFLTSSMKV
ncbi:hypothetical protein PYW07_007600 [Mythimna separata]|uniref:Uncharacterized protein n=1 Tax=Mythimna separata TaxID=271217 RepID=A0AAD8DUX3_MYTSE|nr:hypothetical protein PYW07_007600 [Mythimna separata]